MSDGLTVEQPVVIDILSDQQGPALSSTSDVPIVETKPDSVQAEPTPTVEATEAEAEQPEEPATSATEEESGQPAGDKPRGVGKALAELRQQRREAEERAKAADERLSQALAALERATGKPPETLATEQPQDDPEPVKPAKHEFPDPDTWEQALVDYADKKASWSARREVKAAEERVRRESETRAIEEAQRVVRENYQARISKVQEKYPDFKEVAESPDVTVSIPIAHAIIHREDGPDIQYYLGKNPAEAQRISQLPPPMQLMELGLIVAKLNTPTVKPTISAAPKPIRPISAGQDSHNKSPEEETMEEYASRRKAELRKEARH